MILKDFLFVEVVSIFFVLTEINNVKKGEKILPKHKKSTILATVFIISYLSFDFPANIIPKISVIVSDSPLPLFSTPRIPQFDYFLRNLMD